MFSKLDMLLIVAVTAVIAYRSGYTKAYAKCLEALVKARPVVQRNDETVKVGISGDFHDYLQSYLRKKKTDKGEDTCESSEENTMD